MTFVLIAAVLLGTVIVALGGRLFLQRHVSPSGGENGVFLALVGALVVGFATPAMMDALFPVEGGSSVASAPTGPAHGAAPPSPETAASPSPSAAPSPAASPAAPPAAPESAAPAPAAPPATAPTSAARRGTRTPPDRSTTASSPPAPAGPGSWKEAPQASPEAPVASPPSGSPAAPSPSPPRPAAEVEALSVDVTCTGLGDTMRAGETFTITYDVHSSTATNVGLGTALLDPEGDDQAEASAGADSVAVGPGHTTVIGTVTVPDDLRERTFLVVGRMWPENQVGDDDGLIDESSCGSFAFED